MTVRYSLHPNQVTPDTSDYKAIVHSVDSADVNRIANEIVASGSIVKKPDIMAVLESLLGNIERKVADGWQVNFGGLVEIRASIRGSFDNASDEFQSPRNRIVVAGKRLRDYVSTHATAEKVSAVPRAPSLTELRDIGTGTVNDQLTVSNIAELSGSRLKFDQAETDEGIFLIPTSDPTSETRIEDNQIQSNHPSQLVFLIPTSISAGDYNVEVRARAAGSSKLRTGRIDDLLTAVLWGFPWHSPSLGKRTAVSYRENDHLLTTRRSSPNLFGMLFAKPAIGVIR